MNKVCFRNRPELTDDESRNFSGYGVVFNRDSVPLWVWDNERGIIEVVEQITPASIQRADMNDLISAFNHNFEKILGRFSSNTLTVNQDETGIKYSFKVPRTTYGDDLIVQAREGLVGGSSFIFTIDFEKGYDISEREDGILQASPRAITKIIEMGPVVNPAYKDTTAENRSAALTGAVIDFYKRKEAAAAAAASVGEAGDSPPEAVNNEVEILGLYIDIEGLSNSK